MQPSLVRDVGRGAGLLPQRGHRGARRLQGGVRDRRHHGRREAGRSAAGRRSARARARSATGDRSRRWPACSRRRRETAQPAVAAAICLLGVNCDSHENYLVDTLEFADKNPGFQELLRGAARGPRRPRLSRGTPGPSAPCSIGGFRRAIRRARRWRWRWPRWRLRNTPLMLSTLEKRADRAQAIALLGEGFDMLEEDLDEGAVLHRRASRLLVGARRLAGARPDAGSRSESSTSESSVDARARESQARARAALNHGQRAHAAPQLTGERESPGSSASDTNHGQRVGAGAPREVKMDYRQSGVDIDAGNEAVRRIRSLARGDLHAGRPVRHRRRSAACSASTASSIASPCSSRAPTASARSSRSRS